MFWGGKLYKKKPITADLLKHTQLVLCVCANVVSPHLKKKKEKLRRVLNCIHKGFINLTC